MAEMAQVFDKLLERTLQEKIWWKPTAVETSFVAVVGDFSAVVSLHQHPSYPEEGVLLQILDKEGGEVESYGADTLEPSEIGDKFSVLYKNARRVALNIDQQLDGLLGDLSQT